MNKKEIERLLHSYFDGVYIFRNGDHYSAEFGGELPRSFISTLRELGAEILRYSQRGVVSTVVNF